MALAIDTQRVRPAAMFPRCGMGWLRGQRETICGGRRACEVRRGEPPMEEGTSMSGRKVRADKAGAMAADVIIDCDGLVTW
jgi:hypothetical protein